MYNLLEDESNKQIGLKGALDTLNDQRLSELLKRSNLRLQGESDGGAAKTELTAAEQTVIDLAKGVSGLLTDCNSTLGDACDHILGVYDAILEQSVDKPIDGTQDDVVLSQLRSARARTLELKTLLTGARRRDEEEQH
ncbi:MAG: hypothetical protein HC902_14170 [Calothrix sp. SM1_5_4]|nr:hypothetical protein [Calothrix sp. SM1_5_4]